MHLFRERQLFADLWATKGAGGDTQVWLTRPNIKWQGLRCTQAAWDRSDDKNANGTGIVGRRKQIGHDKKKCFFKPNLQVAGCR